MPGTVSYLTTIKKSGTATVMSSEAMTSTGSTVANLYQVTNAVKRVFDRGASFTLYEDDGTTAGGRQVISAAQISSIDYLFGTVTFSSTQAEPVTISGQYMPMTAMAGANNYSLNLSRDVLDNTDFTSTGYRSKAIGLKDAQLTIGRFDDITDNTIYDDLIAGTPVVAEVRPGGTGDAGRGWFVLESESRAGDVASLETADISLQLDGSSLTSFSFNTP